MEHKRSEDIPVRRVRVSDPSQIPTNVGYVECDRFPSRRTRNKMGFNIYIMTAVLLFRTRTTPGGTLFSTTPGGTRIIYDREFMLQCRNSPLSRTPPAELEKMLKAVHPEVNHSPHRPEIQTTGNHENGPLKGDDNAFEMDV
ncbi:Eukaryotic translation initiation factor 4E-binding protein 2 [Fasciolopsis buskii]|uniref:Eukaryotic translation initiation factor 4E-binding protein 2 n=1 Tax=Fasciolopsis buskii TaxID=27845 RepID=A0A8E0RMN5_9TREM|nr:Eukaryotic translation initiation factor 4E-binding protein 2 [Fasciolopsis buski]